MIQGLIPATLSLPVQVLSILSHILRILYLHINGVCHRSPMVGTAFSSVHEQPGKREVSCIYRSIPLIIAIFLAGYCISESVPCPICSLLP